MKKILIYTTKICPYCVRAKSLLDRKGLKYEEIDATDPNIRNEMLQKSGGMRTVPQIFIGDQHIGGSDDLHKIEQEGKLDKIIQS